MADGSTTRKRSILLVLAALLCGLLIAAAWFVESLWPATWLGLAGLIAVSADCKPYVAFRLWLLAGMASIGSVLHWYPIVASETLRVSLFSGGMVILLLVTWDAFRFALCGFLSTWLTGDRTPRPVLWAITWVALEFLWPHVFPWRLAHLQIGFLPLVQSAEWVGAYGTSFLMMWAAATMAVWLRRWIDRSTTETESAGSLTIETASCLVLLVVLIIWGDNRMSAIGTDEGTEPALRVALIQEGEDGDRHELRAVTNGISPDVDLVVWPESSLPTFSPDLLSFRDAEEVQQHTSLLASRIRPALDPPRPLLCGAGMYAEGTGGPRYNTAYLLNAEADVVGRYHKRHLMPWGEYFLGQQYIPGLLDLLGGHEVRTGDSAAPLMLQGGECRLGVLICYEDLLAEAVRESTAEGAEVLICLSNLSAFGRRPAMWGHQRIARFRAIETRRALLRCGTTGSTAVIGPAGRVIAQAPPYGSTALIATVPRRDGLTLYVRSGDLFARSCVAIAGLLILCRIVVTRTRRRAGREGGSTVDSV